MPFNLSASTRVVTIVWVGLFLVAFTATHLPPSKIPTAPWVSDKIEHGLGFAVLALATLLRFGPARSIVRNTTTSALENVPTSKPHAPTYLGIAIFLAAYAAMDELTQPWVGRSSEWLDWLADLAGTAVGLGLGAVLFRRGVPRR